jgi:hypothetical protein
MRFMSPCALSHGLNKKWSLFLCLTIQLFDEALYCCYCQDRKFSPNVLCGKLGILTTDLIFVR